MNENRESFCLSLAKSVRTTQKGFGPGVPGKLYSKHFKATRLVAMFSYMLLFGVFVEIINL